MLKSVEKKMKLSTIVMVSLTIFVLAINTNMAIAPPVVSPIDVNVTNTPNVNVVNTPQ